MSGFLNYPPHGSVKVRSTGQHLFSNFRFNSRAEISSVGGEIARAGNDWGGICPTGNVLHYVWLHARRFVNHSIMEEREHSADIVTLQCHVFRRMYVRDKLPCHCERNCYVVNNINDKLN